MAWYVYLACFFAGVLLANGVPHFVKGISGEKFHSPFASPPVVGRSSPVVNVIWGLVNFVASYALLSGVGKLPCGLNLAVAVLVVGVLFASTALAIYFARLRNR